MDPGYTLDYSAGSTREQWSPEYRSGDTFVHIDDVRIRECPVSAITPDTQETLNTVLNARAMVRCAGASLYGPNLSEWPVWAVEAMTTVENEHVAVENKLIEAARHSTSGE